MGAGQSTPKITQQDRAILDMKLQRDKLKRYQKQIQHVLDREKEIARQHLAQGNKDRALVALRRRKYQESLLSKTDSQLQTLEQLVSDIEFSLVQVSVMHGLKQGNDVLKEIHKEMNPESVEKLLEETAEARAYQREIDDMLANSLTMDEEDAVQAELLQLQAEAMPNAPQEVESTPELPSVPVHAPSSPVREGETQESETARQRVALEA